MGPTKTWLGALIAATALVVGVCAAPAGASVKRIKLTGTVTGMNTSLPGGATLISFSEGRTKVGTFTIDTSGNCALDACVQGGAGKLTAKVGKLKGKVNLTMDFPLKGFPPHSAGYGTGTLRHKRVSEKVRVNVGEFPRKVGAHFTMTVSY